jgi:hypothetical protein
LSRESGVESRDSSMLLSRNVCSDIPAIVVVAVFSWWCLAVAVAVWF